MKHTLFLSLIALTLVVPQHASACTIPVFRYALERWELSTYDLLVYHRGPLPAGVQAELKKWSDHPTRANVEITLIDLDGKMTAEQSKLWDRDGNKEATAWLLVRLQSASVKEPSVWSGPCTLENVQQITTSPMRQTLLAHLSRGASVVFVLLTSDDVAADEKAFAMTAKQLTDLEKRIKLPVQSEDGPKMRLPIALKVSLPLLVLNRNDPQEAGLVRLLLATEEGLDKAKGPIVFPIFGRGRVLASLAEKELTEDNIFQATNFLCKDCSCQVKELNPGVDLLLAGDWNHIFDEMFEGKQAVPMPSATFRELPKRLAPTPPEQPAVQPTVTPTPSAEPTVVTISSSDGGPQCCPLTNPRNWLWIGTALAGVLVLVTGGWAVMQMRKSS